jgi:hypothetical protein
MEGNRRIVPQKYDLHEIQLKELICEPVRSVGGRHLHTQVRIADRILALI